MSDFNKILREGKIIDNNRIKTLNMKDALMAIAPNSESFKCAVGYFYIEGLIEIINSLKDLKEIKILMGYDTTRPTKEQLLKAFREGFNQLEDNDQTRPALKLFYQLVKEYKTLKVKVYFGEENHPERLHSKAYIFLKDSSTTDLLSRYKAGVIGSSNLTPSGLVGNTELNTIIIEPSELEVVEKWFDELWGKGTEEFEKLRVCEAISGAIESSKFKAELESVFTYIEPMEFIKILIKYLNADYLFEEFKKSKLLQFQYVDFVRILNNFNSKGYRGCFLTSSVGLGKSYVAAQVAKYFLNNDKKVLIFAPAGLVYTADQWPRYLKEFGVYDKVTLVSMGELQKNPEIFRHQMYSNDYGLIVVDEAHNYRNPDAYRTRNLKKIIDENGNSKILFLTATPVNTSLDDLLNLVNLFHRKGSNLLFDTLFRKLGDLVSLFKDQEYEDLKTSEKEELSRTQEEIEREMFVKSTRETIKTEVNYIEELKILSGVDITKIRDPDIQEAKYELDSRYEDVVSGIVDFITKLTAAHLRLLDPEKGVRLGGFFKWILYKRFESDISSYYLTLKRLRKRDFMILTAVEKRDIKYLEEEENEDDIEINFNIDFKEKLQEVIEKIKSGKSSQYRKILGELKEDIARIGGEINKLEPLREKNSSILFKKDQKMNELQSFTDYNPHKKILVFTEYKDTLKAIKEYFKDLIEADEIRFVDSTTDNKQRIIERFNDPKDALRILISTDTLSEGFNISGADSVINFDIPYNPVRIIQRIGRTTRLDNPKEIRVLNFRPADVLDVELKLVERLELRIKDIIRFVGVEYRIWFETEKELLTERRVKDKRMYLEVLDVIRGNLRKGNFTELEVPINYSKPILMFLQKAIQRYTLRKNDLESVTIPVRKSYTLFEGEKGLTVIFKGSNSFNEDILLSRGVVELPKRIDFEGSFSSELALFEDFRNKKKKEELKMQYFNDDIDKLTNSIIDCINSEKLSELFPDATKLKEELECVRNRCGSYTRKVLRRIKVGIKEGLTNDKIKQWISELEESFTKSQIQQKIVEKTEPIFAVGFIEGEL